MKFEKYQGTGNDFVLFFEENYLSKEVDTDFIPHLCDRRFGVGADGFILVAPHPIYDFEMRYFNADGSRSFCGNGARCAVKFAASHGLFDEQARFLAIDGLHHAELVGEEVKIQMSDVKSWRNENNDFIIDTGSPHYIRYTDDLNSCDIVKIGRAIRYSTEFSKDGINVNMVAHNKNGNLSILTYERGVEDETLSCGTGATAAALSYAIKKNLKNDFRISVQVKGGQLTVSACRKKEGFTGIYLQGPAQFVFKGEIEW